MEMGYCLISTTPGKIGEVYKSLIGKVAEINTLFGEFDLIVRIDAEDENAISKTAVEIRIMPDVLDTKLLFPGKSTTPFRASLPQAKTPPSSSVPSSFLNP